MGEVWIPEAEDLKPAGNHNAMSGIGGPRATLHCTVSNPGSFDAMVRVLRDKQAESHLVYDPKTDRLGQFFPLDRAARALARGALAYSHNKVGSVNIQVEVCAMPVDWTAGPDWNPGPNFRAMVRAIRSWGIADEFIYRPARTGSDRTNVVRPNNLLTSAAGGGKWWGHCHYGQGESHWDPGPINLSRFFGAAPVGAPTLQEDDMQLSDMVNVRDPKTNQVVQVPFSTILARQDWVYQETIRQKAVLDAIASKLLTADEVKAATKAALDERISNATTTTVLEVKP